MTNETAVVSSEERFKRIAAILIAVVTTLITIITFLQGDAGALSFFMGSYLDGLPAAVNARVKRTR